MKAVEYDDVTPEGSALSVRILADDSYVPIPVDHRVTYPGTVQDGIGQTVGPDMQGRRLTAVEAIYDHAADTTRLGFAVGVPQAKAAPPTRTQRRDAARDRYLSGKPTAKNTPKEN